LNNIQLNIVANAQFQQVYGEVAKLKAAMTSLQQSSVGGPFTAAVTADIKASQSAFDSAVLSTRAFNIQQVAMTDNVTKFGQQLSKGQLSLSNYYKIWRDSAKGTSAEIDALATAQARLNRSIAIADPLRPGYAKLVTDINGVVTAEEKLIFQQQALNTALNEGSMKLINFGKNTQWMGRQLTVGLTMPLAMFGAATSQAYLKFDQQMTDMLKVYGSHATVQSQQTLDLIQKQVTDLADKLARTLGVAMSDTVTVAQTFSSIGLEGQNLINATEATVKLQKLGGLSANQAATSMVALQNVFKLQGNQIAEAVNFLNAAKHSTSTTMQDIVDALPRVGPIIQQMGGTYKDFATLLVSLKESGVPAAQGANAIKSMLASMINPTSAATKALSALHINLKQIVASNQGNLMGMVEGLQSALNALPKDERLKAIEQVFGKFQFARVTALLQNLGTAGSQSAKVLELYQANNTQLAAVAQQELDVASKGTPAARFQTMKASLQADLIPLGRTFLEAFTRIGDVVNHVVNAFKTLSNMLGPAASLLGKIFGTGAAGLLIAGPVIMLVGLFSNLIGNILRGANAIRMFKQGMESASAGENQFLAGLHGMRNFYQELDTSVIAARNQMDLMPEAITTNAKAFEILRNEIVRLTDQFKLLTVAQTSAMGGISPATGGGIDSAFSSLGFISPPSGARYLPIVPKNNGGLLPGFANGGMIYDPSKHGSVVPGPSNVNYDSVLARVPKGGFVLNKTASQKNPGLATLPHYSSGGSMMAMLTPGETVFDPATTAANYNMLNAANNGSTIGGAINSLQSNYGLRQKINPADLVAGHITNDLSGLMIWLDKGLNSRMRNVSKNPPSGTELANFLENMLVSGYDPNALLLDATTKLGISPLKAKEELDQALAKTIKAFTEAGKRKFGGPTDPYGFENFVRDIYQPHLENLPVNLPGAPGNAFSALTSLKTFRPQYGNLTYKEFVEKYNIPVPTDPEKLASHNKKMRSKSMGIPYLGEEGLSWRRNNTSVGMVSSTFTPKRDANGELLPFDPKVNGIPKWAKDAQIQSSISTASGSGSKVVSSLSKWEMTAQDILAFEAKHGIRLAKGGAIGAHHRKSPVYSYTGSDVYRGQTRRMKASLGVHYNSYRAPHTKGLKGWNSGGYIPGYAGGGALTSSLGTMSNIWKFGSMSAPMGESAMAESRMSGMGRMGAGMTIGMVAPMIINAIPSKIGGTDISAAKGTLGSSASMAGMAMMLGASGPAAAAIGGTIIAIKAATWAVGALIKRHKDHLLTVQETYTASTTAINMFNNAAGKTPKQLATSIENLSSNDNLKKVADYMKGMSGKSAIGTLNSFVSSQLISGMDPSKVKDMVTAILTYTGQTNLLDSALKEIVKDNTNLTDSTKTYLTKLQQQTSYQDVNAKSFKELSAGGQNYSTGLYTVVSAMDSGKLSGDKLISVINGLDQSTKNATEDMNLLKLAADNAGNAQMTGLIKQVQSLMQDAGLAKGAIAGLYGLKDLGLNTDTILAKYNTKEKMDKFLKDPKTQLAEAKAQQAELKKQYAAQMQVQNAGAAATTTDSQRLKIMKDQKKTLDDTIKAEELRLTTIKQQNDYLNKQTDLTNQIKTAEISGNYIQAAQLTQQQGSNTAQYNAQSKIDQQNFQSDKMQENIDALTQSIADAAAKATQAATNAASKIAFGPLLDANTSQLQSAIDKLASAFAAFELKQSGGAPVKVPGATPYNPKPGEPGYSPAGPQLYKDQKGNIITAEGTPFAPPKGTSGLRHPLYSGKKIPVYLGQAQVKMYVDPKTGNVYDPAGNVRSKDGKILGRWFGYDAVNENIVDAYASGGSVFGPGGPKSDMIPAMLSNGEYVMNAASVSKYGVNFMNALNTKRYSIGGSASVSFTRPSNDSIVGNTSYNINLTINASGVTDPKVITQMAQDGVMRALKTNDAKMNKTNMAVK